METLLFCIGMNPQDQEGLVRMLEDHTIPGTETVMPDASYRVPGTMTVLEIYHPRYPYCPECKGPVTFAEGCKTCMQCGWSKCG